MSGDIHSKSHRSPMEVTEDCLSVYMYPWVKSSAGPQK